MIRVKAQPEPESFHDAVRAKGQKYIEDKKIPLNSPLPRGTELPPYWRKCLDELYQAYGGICAYLAIHFERVTGAGSVDHFIAKSKLVGSAYEWANYRLACMAMNTAKREFDDVLDPFEVKNSWFHMNFVDGEIYPNPRLKRELRDRAQATITRLRLNDGDIREMRLCHFQGYRDGLYISDFLRRRSPFVWKEAKRQKLL